MLTVSHGLHRRATEGCLDTGRYRGAGYPQVLAGGNHEFAGKFLREAWVDTGTISGPAHLRRQERSHAGYSTIRANSGRRIVRVNRSTKIFFKSVSQRDLDLLVVQKGKPSPRHGRSRLALRILGLSGQGSSRVVPSRHPTVRRALATTRVYVDVVPLALPAEPEASDTFATLAATSMNEERYEVEGGEGIQFDLLDGERLNMESREGYYSMAWTTALPLEALVPRLHEFLGPEADALAVMVVAGDEGENGEGLDSVLSVSEQRPSFWRLETSQLTLTWEAYDTAIEGEPGLLGVIADEFSAPMMQRLLEATATPLIGAESSELVERCAMAAQRRHPLATG